MSWEEVVPGGKGKGWEALRFSFEISAYSSEKDANNGTHKVLGLMCTMADACRCMSACCTVCG